MIVSLVLLVLAQAQAVSPDAPIACAADERAIAKRFSMAALAMEPESTVGGIYDRATKAEQQCPSSEPIAYYRLRAAELGRGGSMIPSEADRHDLEAMASQAAARFPRSARIATILARTKGTEGAAHLALALDPAYVPAKVALAAAMIRAGRADDARALLEQVPDLGSTPDGFAVLAQARWKMGDVSSARKAAQLALTQSSLPTPGAEPDARDPRPQLSAHETLGLVALEKKQYADAARHLLLAAQNSAEAEAVLANANAEFRRAIDKARRQKKHGTPP